MHAPRCLYLLTVAIFVSVANVTLGFAQEPQATPSRPVTLSLIVVDHSNQSVDDVQKDELRLLENKVPQAISSLSKQAKAVDYGIAVDISGSFKALLPVVTKSVQLLIENQPANDECFIESFSSSDKIETVQEFTSDKTVLLKSLPDLYMRGGESAVVDAIYVAVQHIAERPTNPHRRRALVLFTDGEDRASYYSQEQLLKLLRATDVQLFVVGLVGELDNNRGLIRPSPQDSARQFLKIIARESGGRLFFPVNNTQLSEVLGEISHDLHSQYEISYQSTDPHKDNFHPIRIEVIESASRRIASVVVRPGYYLTPPEIDSKDKKKKPKKP